MSNSDQLSAQAQAFVEQTLDEAAWVFQVLRETRTLSASGTLQAYERVPGEEVLVNVSYPNPFSRDKQLEAIVSDFDGNVFSAEGRGGRSGPPGGRYTKIFREHPDVTSVVHVHTPYLGAWAQSHRTLPFRYVPVQRFQLSNELPVYIDRRQPEQDYILDQLRRDPHLPAIIEANGGSTVWGKDGLRKTAEFILILEEGAQFQLIAEALGGSKEYGPGVLAQQYRMSGLTEKAQALGLLPPSNQAAE